MEKSRYYSVTVRKFAVLTRHMDWMESTQKLYNEILRYYYNLCLDYFQEPRKENSAQTKPSDHFQGALPGSMETMRILEKLTVPGRDKKTVPYPLPWKKVPLYFRRAAINGAISAARSYISRTQRQKERTKTFAEAVTFYKGMYKDFQETEISLKLWTGSGWKWTRCKLRGNTVPLNGQMMSPALVLNKNHAELHIPWKTPVCDGRSVRERTKAENKICAVVFTNKNACIVCCIVNSLGEMENCLFIKGGDEYSHYCRKVTDKLEKSQKSCGGVGNPRADAKYWEKLKNLNDHYAHRFSRQVIDYCEKYGAKILVLPEFEDNHRKQIMLKAGNFSPIHLSTSVRKKLKYKAWQSGIVVLEIQQHKISSVCSVCGGLITRKGSEFFCENGHQGSRYLNSARNLGKKFWEMSKREDKKIKSFILDKL